MQKILVLLISVLLIEAIGIQHASAGPCGFVLDPNKPSSNLTFLVGQVALEAPKVVSELTVRRHLSLKMDTFKLNPEQVAESENKELPAAILEFLSTTSIVSGNDKVDPIIAGISHGQDALHDYDFRRQFEIPAEVTNVSMLLPTNVFVGVQRVDRRALDYFLSIEEGLPKGTKLVLLKLAEPQTIRVPKSEITATDMELILQRYPHAQNYRFFDLSVDSPSFPEYASKIADANGLLSVSMAYTQGIMLFIEPDGIVTALSVKLPVRGFNEIRGTNDQFEMKANLADILKRIEFRNALEENIVESNQWR